MQSIYAFGNSNGLMGQGAGLGLMGPSGKNTLLGAASNGLSSANQPMYRGYSPGKPKWKGGNGVMMGPGNTGFSYQAPGNQLMSGVMTTSGYPMRQGIAKPPQKLSNNYLAF